MPLNLNVPLHDLRGRPFRRQATAEEIAESKKNPEVNPPAAGQSEPDHDTRPMTIAGACVDALLDYVPVDDAGRPKSLTGAEKFARYQLALKINDNTSSVALNATEIDLLKTVTSGPYPPAAVGVIWCALDEAT